MEIISHEMIKPSTPTPFHLRSLKLSLLDQMSPPIYVPLIFFYSHDQLTHQNLSHGQVSQLLKQSLSQILTVFYPLAGRIQKNSVIDCDDSGAEFVEAHVHTQLSEVIDEPCMEELKKLEPHSLGQDENAVLKVKICFFKCGGISVAICLSHKIADGTSLIAFIGAWAASCRGETQDFRPSFNFASYFPPRDLSGMNFTPRVGIANGKIATKRLVFSKKELTKLKEDCVADFGDGGSPRVKEPTRVEAVSSYIWRRFMDLSKAKDGAKTTTFVAVHAVNLRPRKIPPLPQHMFGNCWRPAVAVSEPEANPCSLASKLRAAIATISNDYIQTVESGEYLNLLAKTVGLFKKDGVEFCNFSSWCRFPVYEVDFGWGKPVWVCTTTMPFKNLVILMGSPCGEGIEAWVSVVEEDMELF